MTRSTVLELIPGRMVESTQASGRTASSMDKESTSMLMVTADRACGQRANAPTGVMKMNRHSHEHETDLFEKGLTKIL